MTSSSLEHIDDQCPQRIIFLDSSRMVALQKADTNLDEVVKDVNNLVNCTHCRGPFFFSFFFFSFLSVLYVCVGAFFFLFLFLLLCTLP